MSRMDKPGVFRGAVKVRADATSAQAMLAQLNAAFEEFKAANAQRVKDEVKGQVDALLTAKIENLQSAMDESQAAVTSMAERIESLNSSGGGDQGLPADRREHIEAYSRFMRFGDEEAVRAWRVSNPQAAMTIGSNEDGGYLAPVEWDRTITDPLVEISPMRQLASVQGVTGQGFTKIYNMKGTSSGWVGETADRPETDTPGFRPYSFSFGEIYAMPKISQRGLEDPELDLAAWLGGEVAEEFALQEGEAFLTGDGVNKPKGILMYDAAAETALPAAQRHPLGPIKEVNTGAAANITEDGLLDLIYDIPSPRLGGASFYMNRLTIREVRKLRDADGNPIWQPSNQAGQPAQLLGYAARELFGLPDIAAGAIPVLFGNIERTYRIFDRRGSVLLRDPFTAKPYVLFYTTRRVGGGLWNPEWLRYHRVAA